MKKRCRSCNQLLPWEMFSKCSTGRFGLQAYCIPCMREHARRSALSLKFGISVEKYEEMLEQQNGLCAICGEPETYITQGKLAVLAVDHDKETGKIRGLLCRRCNITLGGFDHDVDRLTSAIVYLLASENVLDYERS